MAANRDMEKQPLLQNERTNNYGQFAQPSAPTFLGESDISDFRNYPIPSHPDELPPPYTATASSNTPLISCRVCKLSIDISGKTDQHVVQCSNCHEATPIRNAPPGKKYVRCPCNCLLICKVSSQRIACPRQNCKRIISLAPSPIAPPVPNMPGLCRVSCPYCLNQFAVNIIDTNLTRCSHCRKRLVVIPEYARRRSIVYLLLAVLHWVILISLVATTYQWSSEKFLFIPYSVLFTTSMILFGLGIYYFNLKAVIIETS